MFDFTGFQMLVSILGTLTTGGVIGSLVGMRYIRKKEQAKAQQEIEQARTLEINNSKGLIELYDKAIRDSNEFHKGELEDYSRKVSELELKIRSYETKLKAYEKNLEKQDQIIEKLTKNQLRLKVQLQSISSLSDSDCSKCSFRDKCEKYKAKQLVNDEQIND